MSKLTTQQRWGALMVLAAVFLLFSRGQGCSVLGPPDGPRQVLIVRESANDTPAMGGMFTKLQTGDYFKSKGHTLDVLDEAQAPTAWKPYAMPELLIIAPPDKVLSREPLPSTADAVIAAVQAQGG